jgi:hypothetical protein
MKTQKSGILCLCLTFCFYFSFAQKPPVNEPNLNKSRIFNDLPDRMLLRVADFSSLLNYEVGQSVKVPVAGNKTLSGLIVSKSDATDTHVKSVVVRLDERQGARLTFTQIQNVDGSTSYLGRIISREHADGFEISIENGEYVFKKTGYYDMVNE